MRISSVRAAAAGAFIVAATLVPASAVAEPRADGETESGLVHRMGLVVRCRRRLPRLQLLLLHRHVHKLPSARSCMGEGHAFVHSSRVPGRPFLGRIRLRVVGRPRPGTPPSGGSHVPTLGSGPRLCTSAGRAPAPPPAAEAPLGPLPPLRVRPEGDAGTLSRMRGRVARVSRAISCLAAAALARRGLNRAGGCRNIPGRAGKGRPTPPAAEHL